MFHENLLFACWSCIQGHRSNTCSHDSRPLWALKNKGRPGSGLTSSPRNPQRPDLPFLDSPDFSNFRKYIFGDSASFKEFYHEVDPRSENKERRTSLPKIKKVMAEIKFDDKLGFSDLQTWMEMCGVTSFNGGLVRVGEAHLSPLFAGTPTSSPSPPCYAPSHVPRPNPIDLPIFSTEIEDYFPFPTSSSPSNTFDSIFTSPPISAKVDGEFDELFDEPQTSATSSSPIVSMADVELNRLVISVAPSSPSIMVDEPFNELLDSLTSSSFELQPEHLTDIELTQLPNIPNTPSLSTFMTKAEYDQLLNSVTPNMTDAEFAEPMNSISREQIGSNVQVEGAGLVQAQEPMLDFSEYLVLDEEDVNANDKCPTKGTEMDLDNFELFVL